MPDATPDNSGWVRDFTVSRSKAALVEAQQGSDSCTPKVEW